MDHSIDYILAIAEYHSISRAAKALYISQPSLSRYLNHLEEELGTALFVRNEEGTELTQAGIIYVEYAKQVRQLHNEMVERLKTAGEPNKEVRVGMTLNSISVPTASKIEDMVHARYPEYVCHIFTVWSKDIPNTIYTGIADFCVGPNIYDPDQFRFEGFYRQPMVMLAPKDMNLQEYVRLNRKTIFPFIDVRHLPPANYVVQDASTSVHSRLEKYFQKKNAKLPVNLMVTNTNLAIQAVEAGFGCCFAALGQLAYVSHPEKISVYQITENHYEQTGLVIRTDRVLSRQEKYAASCIKRCLLESSVRLVYLFGGDASGIK